MTTNREALLAMAKEINAQDNLATAHPIFMVQRHKRTYGFDPAYTDNPVFLDEEHNEVDLVTYDPNGYECPSCCEKLGLDDMNDECCTNCGKELSLGNYALTKTAYQDSWENVQPFFTRKGAEDYLYTNKHNLTGKEPPRVYVDSAYRNAEWQAIRAMLLNMNPSEEMP